MDFDILVINGRLLPVAGQAELIDEGFVVIADNKIVQVGRGKSLAGQGKAKKIIDAKGCLVMPGLINSHCHAAMTLFRGLADDLPLMTWLHEHIFPAEARYVTAEMVYWCTKLAAAEMILSGTTTVADSYFFEHEAARAFKETGLRAVAAQGVIDFPAPGVPDPSKNIEAAAAYLDAWQGEDLVTPAIFCHSPYTCSPQTIKKAKQLADEKNCLLFIHTAETRAETEQLKQEYGLSPVQHLQKLGILDHNTVCVHSVWVDQYDISTMQKSGCRIVTCPESNMKLAAGIAPVIELDRAGVIMGLGTDGCASNNDLDLFQEMDMLAKLHKVTSLDPAVLPAGTALSMATSRGAELLNMGGALGRLAPGMLADLIIIDLEKPHLTPFYNSDLLVYACCGADVTSSIINGRLVMEDRRILSFDVKEAIRRVRQLSRGPAQLSKP